MMDMKKLLLLLALTAWMTSTEAQETYTTVKNIGYVAANDPSVYRKERCKLDVYYPQTKKGFKTIVWFHGGGLEGGDVTFATN